MTGPLIVPIVEGHGEVEAVPILIRRIFGEFRPEQVPVINAPTRVKVGSFLQDEDYFKKYVALAGAKAAQGGGMILILLDCEDDCPAELGPLLWKKARSLRADIPCVVALAHREFEAWFVAAVASLGGKEGLSPESVPPPVSESIRGAKEWLGERMSASYDPIIHQARFAAAFDLAQARTNSSFDRLVVKLVAKDVPAGAPQ